MPYTKIVETNEVYEVEMNGFLTADRRRYGIKIQPDNTIPLEKG